MKLRDKLEKTGHSKTEYGERFEKEFKVLNDFGLSDYFLIVHDIINYARGDGQLTGAGRGSAAGSLVLYLLGVTALDPLEYDLLFERFMNAGRGAGTMPDVDMDFERGSRPKIIQYIKNKYGSDKVAHMVTFGRLQGRGSLKEVMRVHNACSFEEMNKITEHIPGESEISDQLQAMKEADKAAGGDGEASIIECALEHNSAELKPWAYYNDADVIEGSFANIFAQAIRLEGTKITQGKHPSGVIISNDPLAEICPMVYDKTDDEMIVGFDFNDAEHIGLVKFDILAVNLLDKIHGVFNLLRNGKLK